MALILPVGGEALPLGDFLLGAALLALALSATGLLAVVVVRRFCGELAGIPRALAVSLLWLAGVLAVHFVPGVLGILGRGSVAACSALALIGALVLGRGDPPPRQRVTPDFPPGPASGRLSWGLALLALAMFTVYIAAWAADHGSIATLHVDMTTFHLPNAVRWIQTGSFWQDDEFVPYRSFGTYPNTSDLLSVAVMLPFKSDFLARPLNLPLLALTLAGIYALGRELAAPAAPSLLFAVGFVATPVVTFFAFEGMSDTLMLATFACGVFFLARERRTRSRSDLVLAALGLGISFGTKWYALPAVAIAVIAWAGASLFERRPARDLVARTAVVTGVVALAGGFWLLRNLIEVGNPVYPTKVSLAAHTIFDAPVDIVRERTGFALSHYLDQPGIWRDPIWPTYLFVMGWMSVALWAAAPISAGLAWARGRRGPRPEVVGVLLCVAAAGAIGVVFVVTPYSAMGFDGLPVIGWVNARYVAPALVFCAALAAWTAGRAGRLRLLLETGAVLLVLDALRRDPDVSASALSFGFVVVVLLVAVAWLGLRLARKPGFWRWPRAAALVGAAAVLAFAGLWVQQRRFNDGRYDEAGATDQWVGNHAPAGRRIGVVGDGFVVHPMFGPRFDNEVEYVGPVVDEQLVPYTERRRFAAALARGRYDLVLLQEGGLIEHWIPRRQKRWLRQLGYSPVAAGTQPIVPDQRATLYRAPSEAS